MCRELTLHLRSRTLRLHEEGRNGTVAVNGKPREIRGGGAANCIESSVKKCHVISRVMKVTPDIRHLGSVSRERSNYVQVGRSKWRANLIFISIERDGR
jgi:hypothetical protein